MYDRRIAGKELTFGVSGKLHANSLIMYDHQTDSLWSHLVGAAVTGPLKERKLKVINSMFTRWDTWKRLYPKTKVLRSRRRSGRLRDIYEVNGYYSNPEKIGIIPTRRSDRRIHPKEYVLALVLSDKAKAYPFSVLSRDSVVNDTFQGIPLLVVFDEETATGVIFKRRLKRKTLSFKKTQLANKKGLFLADDATGSVWDGLTGRAVQGKFKDTKLEPLPATPSFWFGWVDHYPDTELYSVNK